MYKSLLKIVFALVLHGAALAQASPSFNRNDWNFVLVPAFEQEAAPSNNLSSTGLNHALRFGQLLDSQMVMQLGHLRQVYALVSTDKADDMTPLETIEPFAVLNRLPVITQGLSAGDPTTYGTPGYFVRQILNNQPRGSYVMAMPPAMIAQVVAGLTNASVNPQGSHQYVVVSGASQPLAANVYDDQIATVDKYPGIPQPLPAPAQCSQPPVTLHAKAPASLQAYRSQTIYLVRHVEAHPVNAFENGNYVCQGQWRALGANGRLMEIMHGRKPDYVYTSNPSNIIECGADCAYVRPSLTVAPFAIEHHMPLKLAEYQWSDADDLAQSLINRNSPYFQRKDVAASILVGWEHAHIEQAVQYLFGTLYQAPQTAAKVPAWSYTDYDTVWELKTDERGDLTFRNTCEGIPSTSLPSTCPAYFP
jgi:hypothetical protein